MSATLLPAASRVYETYTSCYHSSVSVPVTSRLEEAVVDALDRAVEAGLAPSRGSVVATAVREWLARHGENAIADSYRRRYAAVDDDHERLIASMARFSVAACLADEPT